VPTNHEVAKSLGNSGVSLQLNGLTLLYFDSRLKSFAQINTYLNTVTVLQAPTTKLSNFSIYHDKTKNQVYLAGGVEIATNQTSKKVLKYDVMTSKWTEMAEMTEARKQPTLFARDGCLIARQGNVNGTEEAFDMSGEGS
jgi:L-rhamnose mutarotase